MITHLDSEKLTKTLSALCFAAAVLAGHSIAGDAAAEATGQVQQSAPTAEREAADGSTDEEIQGNPTVHPGMSGTNKADMENRSLSLEEVPLTDVDEPRMELTKELDINNPAKRTDSPNEY